MCIRDSIYIIGTIFVLIVMGMNPFVTTQGFATFSMMTTVIGAVCNICLLYTSFELIEDESVAALPNH